MKTLNLIDKPVSWKEDCICTYFVLSEVHIYPEVDQALIKIKSYETDSDYISGNRPEEIHDFSWIGFDCQNQINTLNQEKAEKQVIITDLEEVPEEDRTYEQQVELSESRLRVQVIDQEIEIIEDSNTDYPFTDEALESQTIYDIIESKINATGGWKP